MHDPLLKPADCPYMWLMFAMVAAPGRRRMGLLCRTALREERK